MSIIQEAIKIPGLLVEIYGDLAKPGVKQAGKALETIIGLGNTILWPAALANEHSKAALAKNLERLRSKLENIPEDEIVGITPEIGVPLAEKLSYVRDEQLAEMYSSLLASASKIDTQSMVHPSFVNIINNISPDEARLLDYLATHIYISFIIAKAVQKTESKMYVNVLSEQLLKKEITNTIIYSENIGAYLDNLVGLGLITVNDQGSVNGFSDLVEEYKSYYESTMQDGYEQHGVKIEFDYGLIKTTSYGHKFVMACHTEKS